MPAKDIYHEVVKNALIKDGWTITHDPLRLPLGGKDEPLGRLLLKNNRFRLIGFDAQKEVIVKWIP